MTELYDPLRPELVEARRRARALLARYNATAEEEQDERAALLRELLARVGTDAWIEPPFFCDYGTNLFVGERFYANTGCIVLDAAPVTIGARALFGPAVQLLAATHPVEPELRAQGLEYAAPIAIGDDAWLGGGAIVLPGVTIGDRAVVGAGSVVTRDVPADTVVAGNPARVIRTLEEAVT
ncbi:MAG TPA: sugar O-acetyltransferase [Gaiellaceae bacterium]|jgi:maltose O-acetyltransferase|nr:sugar O-acetyltransferase [Gaiellaceae bacterium]